MTRDIYIVGAGGHGSVTIDLLKTAGIGVSGILDPSLNVGDHVYGITVLGGDEYLDNIDARSAHLVNGIGASPDTARRQSVFTRLLQKGFSFLTLTHDSAVVGSGGTQGMGSQIMAGAVVQCGVLIDQNAVINTRASLDHDCKIGAHSFIAPGAVLCGRVEVGAGVFVGAGAIILPGVRLGSRSVVGAGSVVTRNIMDDWVVVGCPASRIGGNQ